MGKGAKGADRCIALSATSSVTLNPEVCAMLRLLTLPERLIVKLRTVRRLESLIPGSHSC